MRTTVELDDQLVAKARQVLAGPSLKAMIESSLREAIRTQQREALRRALGNFDLAINEHDLEEMRRDRVLE